MIRNVIISVDGENWRGYAAAARVVATTTDYLFMKAHKCKGQFVLNGRNVKVLNFAKVANWPRYEKQLATKRKCMREFQSLEKAKEYNRLYHQKYMQEYRKKNLEKVREWGRRASRKLRLKQLELCKKKELTATM